MVLMQNALAWTVSPWNLAIMNVRYAILVLKKRINKTKMQFVKKKKKSNI